MSIPFTCPHCQTSTEVDPQYAGRTGPCAVCGKEITVPEAPAGPQPVRAARAAESPGVPASTGMAIGMAVVGILVFAAMIVAGLAFAWFVPTVTYNSAARQISVCSTNLQRIAAAMEAYRAEHGTYPPAYVTDKDGKPMHSWRVLLLAYLDEHELLAQYNMNEPWNGPNNARLARRMPAVYGCPTDTALDYSETSYLLVTGEGTLFEGDQALNPATVRDGLSRTIMMVEVANSSINWLQPRDLPLAETSWSINQTPHGIGSMHTQGGAHVLLADGSVVHLSNLVPSDQLRGMLTRDGGEPVDPYQWSQ